MEPSYEQRAFDASERLDRFQLVASRSGANGSLRIHQDVGIYLCDLSAGGDVSFEITPGRHVWVQVLEGSMKANGHAVSTGDAVAASDERALRFNAETQTQLMLFDLA